MQKEKYHIEKAESSLIKSAKLKHQSKKIGDMSTKNLAEIVELIAIQLGLADNQGNLK